MVDIVIFSKDRPLQLFSTLESILKFVKGYNSIYVLFNATTEDYLESYSNLNRIKEFKNIHFVNETQYGFANTFKLLLDELKGPHLMMEIDDAIYCDDIDLKKHSTALLGTKDFDCGRVNFTADYTIYNTK